MATQPSLRGYEMGANYWPCDTTLVERRTTRATPTYTLSHPDECFI